MTEKKYGKYVMKPPIFKSDKEVGISINFRDKVDFGEADFSMVWMLVTKPNIMEKVSHSHYFDQFLLFLGSNSMDVEDFGAEIELSLGEEEEKHTINSPTVVYVPAGLIHNPINFKKVDKPIVFQEMMLARSYGKKPPSE